jgi:hypothetical protein
VSSEFLSGCVPDEIHFYVSRFSLNEIENNEENTQLESLKIWLNKRWLLKESFLKW